MPVDFTVLSIASKMFLYGNFPSLSAVIPYSLVFALSNGKLIVAATVPARNVASPHDSPRLFGMSFASLSFASS